MKRLMLVYMLLFGISVQTAQPQNSSDILRHRETFNDGVTGNLGILELPRRGAGLHVNGKEVAFAVDSQKNFCIFLIHRTVYSFGGPGTADGEFNSPGGIDVDSNGNIYIADTGNARVQRFHVDFNTGDVTHLANITGFNSPLDVVITGNSFWVLDQGSCQVKEYTLDGTLLYTLGTCGVGAGQFNAPAGISARMSGTSISPTDIIVADAGNGRVVFSTKGTSSGLFDDWKTVAIPASDLTDVASDAYSNVYATDRQNDLIHILSGVNKEVIATFGGPGTLHDQFINPYSITFSPGTYKVGVTEDWTTTNGLKRYEQIVDIVNLTANADGSIVAISCDLVANALITINIFDSAGGLVRTLIDNVELPAQPHFTTFWNGDNSNGDAVGPGSFTIKVTATSLFQQGSGSAIAQRTDSTNVDLGGTNNISNIALALDGSNDEVRIPDDELLSGGTGKSITVEAWAKINSLTTSAPIVMKWLDSQDKDWGLRVKDTGELQVAIESAGDDWEYSVGSVPVGLWNHLAFTFDNSVNVVHLYINGNQVGAGATLTGNMPNTTADILFGKHGYNPEYLDGALAEVRIWNYARSEGEIRDSMNDELSGTESGLIGYWPLNENSGQVASDIVSGNNGQLGTTSGSDSADPVWFNSEAPIISGAPTQFTLTTSTVGAGIISLSPTGGVYDLGAIVTVTAIPATGAQLSNWGGSLSGSANPAQITMNANKTVTATFSGTPGGGTENALSFDGGNDVVQIPDAALLSGGVGKSITVEAWAKINSLSTNAPLVMKFDNSQNKDWGLPVKSTGELQVAIESNGDNWEYLAGTVAAGVWTHLAFAFDNSANIVRLYINGTEVGSGATLTKNMPNTTADVLLGQHNYLAEYLDGALDEIRVWNIARSEAEIQNTMNQALAGTESGLIGYWPLDEGTGQVASDIVSGNNGQLGSSSGSDSGDPGGYYISTEA